MLEFQWGWVFWLLPLPWLLRLLWKAAPGQRQAALKVPHLDDFQLGPALRVGPLKAQPVTQILAGMIWVGLLLAAARPQWIGDPMDFPVSGRDLMLAVDLSGSMSEKDFILNNRPVDRLTATKAVAGEFIDRRQGDRLGLILFGRNAYLQAPLTFDRITVRTLLDEAVIGLAGKETAIGDAIGLAVKRLRQNNSGSVTRKVATPEASTTTGSAETKIDNNRVLILLTDGANTAGEVEPKKAAELAAHAGLKIYTIGIGADEMLVPSLFGSRRVNPSADLDEDTLREIGNTTGGRYFRARDVAELEEIYRLIDELEPVEREQHSFRPTQAMFVWPLAMAIGLAMLLGLWTIRKPIG